MRAEDEAQILACIPSLRRYARGLTGDPDRADDLLLFMTVGVLVGGLVAGRRG